MDQAPADLVRRRHPDGREGDRAAAWLGWIACHMGDQEHLGWWTIPALLPARQLLRARWLTQFVVAAAAAIASLAIMFPRFSPWSVAYLLLAYLAARRLAGRPRGDRGRRGTGALPPVRPRAVVARWPAWTAPVAGKAGAGSYRADRLACAASGLAWAPAGAIAGAMLCGWGSVSAWPAVVGVHAAAAAAIAGLRSGAYPRLKLAELALAAEWEHRVTFVRLLEDAANRGILRREPDGGYAFADEELRAHLAAAGEQALAAHARQRMSRSARKGPLSAIAAGLSGPGITRISADLAAGTYAFAGLILLALPGPVSWTGVVISLVLLGPVGGAIAFLGAHPALSWAAAAARRAAAAVAGLSRTGLLMTGGAAAVLAIATGALLVADAGTFLARALAIATPSAFVAACGLWTCVLAFRRWRGAGSRWRRRVPDAIAVATTGAALLVLVDRELLTTEAATVVLFPVAITASVKCWVAMGGSRRLAVKAAADITASLLLGAELVLFLVWLANILGMSRAEVAALRSALEAGGSAASAVLDWRIWVSAYIVLAAASMAFAVWPARLRAAATWFDRLHVATAAGAVQRAATGLSIGLLTVVLLAAAGPAALVPLLRHQLRATYVVALQRQFAADGEVAAYTRITRAFAPRLITFPVLADFVRAVHDKDGPAPDGRDATRAEADLAHHLGQLQAVALALGRPPSPDQASQVAARGFDGPVRDVSDLGHQAARAQEQEGESDAAGKRVELAAELAAGAVASAISIPQVSSNEVVAVITEYLSGLIEDSPLKDTFAAWLERVPRGGRPPDAVAMVVPDPASLALAAQEQLRTQASADRVILPLTGPSARGSSDEASVKAAVDLASAASDIRRTGTCTGCIRLPDPHEEPPGRERPREP